MQIAAIIKNGKETGGHIIIADKQESKDLVDILTEYCKQNPRKKKAGRFLKQLEENLCCY